MGHPSRGMPSSEFEYRRLCSDLNYAYETGYNAGLKRAPLDTSWIGFNCAPAWQPYVRERYQNGYLLGSQNAPAVLQIHGARPYAGPGYRYVESCRFSSDCGEGRTCRANQCMGLGVPGDVCWFPSDCLSSSCDIAEKVCR
ncbi:MAG: hypothetical protein AB7P03_07770 [Kofleriaceae bacterium]